MSAAAPLRVRVAVVMRRARDDRQLMAVRAEIEREIAHDLGCRDAVRREDEREYEYVSHRPPYGRRTPIACLGSLDATRGGIRGWTGPDDDSRSALWLARNHS